MIAQKYPRFGGDIKENSGARCELCRKRTLATHVVKLQTSASRGDDVPVFVCAYHVGMARRFHTFDKFMDLAQKGES